jgi:hypothetical protein
MMVLMFLWWPCVYLIRNDYKLPHNHLPVIIIVAKSLTEIIRFERGVLVARDVKRMQLGYSQLV